jgi:hypothetical protein
MQNSVAPSEYTSDAGVGVSPASTSGAVNAGEPVTTPVAVWKPPAILAIPKSVNCGSPYSVSRTLPGFTSRCSMPARLAASSAPASFTPMRRVSHQSIGPCRRISASSEPLFRVINCA